MPWRLLLSILSGLSLRIAQPGIDWWPFSIVGVALLALATSGVNGRRGTLLGFVAGLAFFLPVLAWSNVFVGVLPWAALCVLQSLYIAGVGGLSSVLQGRSAVPRIRPVAITVLWVVGELLRSTTPWGGFPWVRLAFSLADSPLARVASLLGAPGVGAAVALAGGLLAVAVRALVCRRSVYDRLYRPAYSMMAAPSRRTVLARTVAVPVCGLAAVLLAPLAIPVPTDGATTSVLAVQGNVPKPGLDFNEERRAVLDNHARLTQQAAEEIAAGRRARPDIVVWPENSADIDPLRNEDAAQIVAETVRAINAPLLVGAVLDEPDAQHVTNASLLYRVTDGAGTPSSGATATRGTSAPAGAQVRVTARYAKRHPVPFAEYIPYRSFFRRFSDKVDYVSREFVAGTGITTIDVPRSAATGTDTGAGSGTDTDTVRIGPNICFEIAYDDLVRDGVRLGANIILVQTNNATFGFTDESVQQLSASRIRALEFGRSVIHVSTVGVSALITPDGVAHQRTELYTPALLAADLPLRTELTLAARLGQWPEYAACAALVLLLALGRGRAGSAGGGTDRAAGRTARAAGRPGIARGRTAFLQRLPRART